MATEEQLRDYLRRATADLRATRDQLRELGQRDREPVAIVGMSCRFPGGVRSPQDLWEVVAEGRDAITGFPDDRGWDLGELYDPDPARLGHAYTRRGGFLHDAGDFDAAFFGISPLEALAMDPQQRLLLETSWEALEDARIDPASVSGTHVGVFAGATYSGYGGTLSAPGEVEGYLLTGSTPSVMSGRVAYALGLEGPALTVDTACSSSLVALHLACQSLRRDECSLALAGGVTVMATPLTFVEFSRQRGLSADGRCKAFAAAADGTGWGEGAGILVLERLSDARALGHRVLAVVRGSAVNQDGASNGLTAPNGPSQQRVIRQALASAGLSAADVDVVEAHGTGTRLGDPIEAQALLATYGQGRDGREPLLIGSVKSNIGHTQAAAGVAGVIKTVMAMSHGAVPATLHVDAPTPEVDWASGAVRVAAEAAPWPQTGERRRTGVSSFGVSGTNAHVIIEQAPAPEPGPGPQPEPDQEPESEAGDGQEVVPLPLSARGEAALRALAARLAPVPARAVDIGYTLAAARASLTHRAVVLAGLGEGAVPGLRALAEGRRVPEVVTGVAGRPPRVVFVFPGQGPQWAGMGRDLLPASPTFAVRMAECAAALAPFVTWDLFQVLDDARALERDDVVQPALWAVMVSLAETWRSYGVEPAAVVGHSQGEIAAAVVAGALTLEEGARVVALRSKALLRLAGRGAMASVALPVAEVAAEPGLSVAAVNGPSATVITGDPGAVAAAMARYEQAGVRTRLVPINYASHSSLVEELEHEMAGLLRGLEPAAGTVPFHSTVTGGLLPGTALDGGYWYSNLRQPILLDAVTSALAAQGPVAFIEVSPHPVLLPAISETAPAAATVGTLRRDDGGIRRLLASLAEAYVAGIPLDWTPALPAGHLTDLPTYPFQHHHYWLQATTRTGSADGVRYDSPAWQSLPDDAEAFRQRFVNLAEDQRGRELLRLVQENAAWVLGHEKAESIGANQRFRDAGFDSMAAVKLRSALQLATGIDLPATLVFDYPTPSMVAAFLDDTLMHRTGQVVVFQRASADEPVAIVAMGCRYPGGVQSPEELWDLVWSGTDAITSFPADRGWDLSELFDPDPDHPATTYVREGGFLHDAADFDAEFFGINRREALAMDPQQRLLLETAWETVERAGLDPAALGGSRVGVFVGATASEYGAALSQAPEDLGGYLLTGNLGSVLSGRLSYTLGLEGAAITVDTACSSSLVAIHLAVRALRAGECEMAVAAGVTIMATPTGFVDFSRQRGLAPDGRCKAFAAAADGTNWAEGVGVLLLERLSDARREGHRVLAVVRGSATNQDGASNGLTAPNGPAQQRVIRQALADARLMPGEVDVVEAHGTGTRLGDPIEAQALLATYGRDRPAGDPLWLGSLKSNIGHTGPAAGVGGVIKMVMALRNQALPPTLHVDEPTPHVDWSSSTVALLTEGRPWPRTDRPRRAGVSSFGMSGTNAHVVLEEAADPVAAPPGARRDGASAWVLSGRDNEALRARASQMLEYATDSADISGVGVALATTRSVFERRAVVVGDDAGKLREALTALIEDRASPGLVTGLAEQRERPVLVFPGQGSQWPGMAVELYGSSPEFARCLDQCAEALAPFADWSLIEALKDESLLDRVDVVQPVLWAVMVSLAGLWRAYGVRPAAVVGHSQGEIAAACVAGALTLDDGARVVSLRSRALSALSGRGGMASLALSLPAVEEKLSGFGDRISVAAVNGLSAVVVSGDDAALTRLLTDCAAEGVRARRIAVDYASHSRQVEEIRDKLLTDLATVTSVSAAIPFCSTVVGEVIDTAALDAEYWYRNLRQPVRLDLAVRHLVGLGHSLFVEASPHPVLTSAIGETIEESGSRAPVAVGSLRRDDGGLRRFLLSLGESHAAGADVDWRPLFGDARPAELPTYPFQRTRYWPAPRQLSAADGAAGPFWDAVRREDLTALARSLDVAPDAPLSTVVPALAAWRRRYGDQRTVGSWCYQVAWRPVATAPVVPGTWLVVCPPPGPADDVVRELLADLEEHGIAAVTTTLEDFTAPASGEVNGVLSLLALDARIATDGPPVPVAATATATLVRLLADTDAPLWVVTRGGAAAVAADFAPDTTQAQVWAVGRVAALEHPDRWGGLIDLPSLPNHSVAARLAAALTASRGEDQLAVREGALYARRLIRAYEEGAQSGTTWRPRGAVLVTGGTGALGGQVARWLARNGASQLVLVGRRGAEAEGTPELAKELKALGAEVTIAACDVADREALMDLLTRLREDRVQVRSVVHAAGVQNVRPLAELTEADWREGYAAKVGGAIHLNDLLDDRELDAFVLFSSNAGVWGSGGHAVYGAANAFLDALAQQRRARGAAATSVAWGAWDAAGMSMRGAAEEYLRRRGVRPMHPDLALMGLQHALDTGETFLAVADMEWDRFIPAFTSGRPSPLLSELPEYRQVMQERAEESGAPSGFAERLSGLPGPDRERFLRDLVRDETAAILGHASAETITGGRAFKEVGFDSLTAVELRNRLNKATGLRLPATLVFDHPTPAMLAKRLLTELAGDDAGPASQLLADLARLEAAVTDAAGDEATRLRIGMRLRTLAARWDATVPAEVPAAALDVATDEDLFHLVDNDLGIS